MRLNYNTTSRAAISVSMRLLRQAGIYTRYDEIDYNIIVSFLLTYKYKGSEYCINCLAYSMVASSGRQPHYFAFKIISYEITGLNACLFLLPYIGSSGL